MRPCKRSLLDTRRRAEPILQLGEENDTLLVVRILLAAKTHLSRRQPVNAPPRIWIDEALQAT